MTAPVIRPLGEGAHAAGPRVATDLAARLLARTPQDRALGTVPCEIDWARPVDLPLSEEREVQAACGIMQVHGRAGGQPAPLGVDYACVTAGVLAAQGVLAALVARARGLRIDGVRTSVSRAALFTLTQYLAAATTESTEENAAAECLAPGTALFTSADGVRFECETLDPLPWRDFWALLGADRGAVARGWGPFQTRYATATCPLPEALHDTLRRLPFAAVREAAERAGVGVLRVREDPWPPVAVPPWTYAAFPESPQGPATGAEGSALAGPLAGLRVVESTRRVQGPMAGHVLHLLGAQVTRIEPPGGDPMRGIPPMAGDCSARFSALNSGKQVAQLDLASAPGRRAARELVADADVFLHNWAPGRARRWRLDADDLRAVRPGLVYAWCSGWGDGFGPTPPLGTDFLVQTGGGLAAAVRPADEPAAVSLMTLTDVLGGLVSATGVLAGLLGRVHTGRGGRVDSSLYSAATLIPRPHRRAHWTPLDRPVRTADGHLWLGRAARTRTDLLAHALDLPGHPDRAALAARFAARTTDDWLPRLAEAGLTATPVCPDLRRLPADPRFAAALTVGEYAVPRTPWEFS